jgi:hypothetical protein
VLTGVEEMEKIILFVSILAWMFRPPLSTVGHHETERPGVRRVKEEVWNALSVGSSLITFRKGGKG